MKKIIYSILAVGLALTGCADFDDVSSVSYGDGPAISIEVSETTDSTFTFTLTPASSTLFYSYAVVEGAEAEAIDAAALLKKQIAGINVGVLNAENNATYTYNMRDAKNVPLCAPNTSYIIYAVASSKEGITGDVASYVVTTTDGENPAPKTYKEDGAAKSVSVTFSEAVTEGEGKVTAQYYVEWTNKFVDIAAEDISVDIDANVATITTSTVPAGATVLISWETGAFIDGKGNKCAALSSGLNAAGTAFKGVYYQIKQEPFEIADSCFTAPEAGSTFSDWTKFVGKVTFEFDVYRNGKTVKDGDLKVIYTSDNKTTTVAVPASSWETNGNELIFTLPEAPQFGDWVGVEFAEEVFTDAYGNPNKACTFEKAWLYSYNYKRDMVRGSYKLTFTGYFDEKVYEENITIIADAENPNGVILSGFLGATTGVKAIFNGDYATITIQEEQKLMTTSEYIYTICGAETEDSSFVLNVDSKGNLSATSLFGYYTYDLDGKDLGWDNVAVKAQFIKQEINTASVKTAKSYAFSAIHQGSKKLR